MVASMANSAMTEQGVPELTFAPVSAERWGDLQSLFGKRGGRDGCWCMRWRLQRVKFEQGKGDSNRRTLQAGVADGSVQGVIGYVDDLPVSWCAVGPRTDFPVLESSEILQAVDDKPVWSISCCFTARRYRRQGFALPTVSAAVAYALECGASLVEGYPIIPRLVKIPVAAAWTGFASTFEAAGFEEVERRVDIRPIVRFCGPTDEMREPKKGG